MRSQETFRRILVGTQKLADRWEKDLSDLKEIDEISEDEALSEGDVLEHLWDYMEEVNTLADDIYEDEEDDDEEEE